VKLPQPIVAAAVAREVEDLMNEYRVAVIAVAVITVVVIGVVATITTVTE
jgi:hypothetical protein